jgi:hypothetical protein
MPATGNFESPVDIITVTWPTHQAFLLALRREVTGEDSIDCEAGD